MSTLNYIRTELDGFLKGRRAFVTYQDKVYSVTDPALSHLHLESIKIDGLREPNILLFLATETVTQKRASAPPKRLRLVR